MLTIAVNTQFNITASISVEDGHINGLEYHIKYIQFSYNNATMQAIMWIEFGNRDTGKNRNNYIFIHSTKIPYSWKPIFAVRVITFLKVRGFMDTFLIMGSSCQNHNVAQNSTYKQFQVDMLPTNKLASSTLLVTSAFCSIQQSHHLSLICT